MQAINRISKLLKPGVVIEKLTVDTFGFSRGAAAARYCVHRVLNDTGSTRAPKHALKKAITGLGRTVEEVEIWAVGLFDTVSSLGVFLELSDVGELKLNAVRFARSVYHLAAAEEYRKNFSLTNIKSAGGKGKEIFLPGAHSDIGGGYVDGASERKTLIDGSKSHAIGTFLRENGWYVGDDPLVQEYMGNIPFGMWERYRAKFSWTPVFEGMKTPVRIDRINYINGERDFLLFPMDEATERTARAVPSELSFIYREKGKAGRMYEVMFDPEETLATFHRLSRDGKPFELVARTQVVEGQGVFSVVVRNQDQSVALTKATHGIYRVDP